MSGAYAELPISSPGFVGNYGHSDVLEHSDLDPLPLEQTWRSDTNPLQLEHEGLSTPQGEVPLELAMHEYEHTIHLAWPSARVEAVTLMTIGLTCVAMAVLPFSGWLPPLPPLPPPLPPLPPPLPPLPPPRQPAAAANTLVNAHAMREYEQRRSAECNWDADVVAPNAGSNESVVVATRGSGRGEQAYDPSTDRAIVPPPALRRCTLSDGRTFIARLGPIRLGASESILWSVAWPFGASEEKVIANL
jgi:hypothetical protein